ncbi:uncharacterized protein LOC124159300 isoform X1 [Ischnura elegans]|uniref:uncharacterized protein LOC124159300 isoform X1 n=1 Tax=Ischnura elegans TaxID=197161 RepID=UPI001ED8ACA8|nr:uncharacterized protein LOC124159300 isoform X1 [Ischnura elegans]
MRRRDGNTLLFVGDKSVLNPSLLFQFASHWAENGIRVSYLSAMPLNELPTPIHGAGFPSPTALNQIQLLYLPKWHDLLQHLLSLHCHAHVPRAIIVNGLNHYCPTSSGQISTNDRSASDTSVIARICASLLDALNVCSIRNDDAETYCVCSVEMDNEIENNSISYLATFNIFFSNIWIMESVTRHCCRGSNTRYCSSSGKCLMVKIKKLLTSGLKEEGDTLEFCSRDCVLFLQKFTKILQS